MDDVIVRARKVRTLKSLAVALGALGIVFLAAVFGLSFWVLDATKALSTRGALLTTPGGAPVRVASAEMRSALAEPPADVDAYVAVRYPGSTAFGNSTFMLPYGPTLYKYTYSAAGLDAGTVAAQCRATLEEGQGTSLWRLEGPAWAGGFGSVVAYNRVLNCRSALDADPAGPVPPVKFWGVTPALASFFYGCEGDRCDAFLELDIPVADFVAGAAPAGRRRRLLSAEEAPAAMAASGRRACAAFGGAQFAASAC